jgi:hypothetical protein
MMNSGLRVFTPLVLIASGLWLAPAQATCLRQESTLPSATILLMGPSGKKPIKLITKADGTASVKGLRKGQWQARIAGEPRSFPVQVAKGSTLKLKTITESVRCSAPPHPNAPPPAPPQVQNIIVQVKP